MNKATFTFAFKGENAEKMRELFSAYFWDGGLDQLIEQGFLEEHFSDLDAVSMDENGDAIINTNDMK